jgi:hypothetical protein
MQMAEAPASTLFDEILDFLSASPTAEEIIAFQVPEHLQIRLSLLLEKNRGNQISYHEQKELDEFMAIDRLVSRLKARARKKLMAL